MKISVKLKPNSKISRINQLGNTHFEVWVKAPAVQGKANAELINTLAKYFKTSKSNIKLAKGSKSKIKTVIIEQKIKIV